ncbi:hypothetical protein GCM10010512_42870 [Streptomyces thermoviolaceus subsp. thermoviolaceus]|nr:hypothetical protein GCM10010499_48930 [Streptomyces thermoviolaceus subsp. apingens]GHB06816.1 hypothetical protein GCM10010512_42870 [Streptomyces thermoviolaceus subsp. thermoviolaceus]
MASSIAAADHVLSTGRAVGEGASDRACPDAGAVRCPVRPYHPPGEAEIAAPFGPALLFPGTGADHCEDTCYFKRQECFMRIRMTAAAVLAGTALMTCAGTAAADATGSASASNSPGLLSGNAITVPLDLDLNLCGNSINVIGLLNPAAGNACANK